MAMSPLERKFLKLRFSLKVRMNLYKKISAFLTAKITLNEGLLMLRNRYRKELSLGEKLNVRFKPGFVPKGDFRAVIITEWLERMADGQSFSRAIQDWVPSSEHMLIQAGERGKSLAAGMRDAAGMSEANSRIKKTIIGNSIQPVVLVLALVAMFILFQHKMVPIFKVIKPVEQWPSSAVKLYNISYFIDHYLILVIGAMIGVVYGLMLTLPRWKGLWRQRFDGLPPWSIYRTQQASSFLIGVASLLEAGVPINQALQLMHRNGTAYFRWHLERMMNTLASGATPGVALNTGLLDRETAGNVEDYSRMRSFREAIAEMGHETLEESIQRIETTMGALKNVMLIIVAGSVLWIYATTYLLQADLASSATNASSSMPH
jgi:type II secretory pathway component PulF